jgi:hypothetical protein
MLEIIRKTNLAKLYFVVPRSNFKDFKKERVDLIEKSISEVPSAKKKRKLNNNRFEQFVIALEIKLIWYGSSVGIPV